MKRKILCVFLVTAFLLSGIATAKNWSAEEGNKELNFEDVSKSLDGSCPLVKTKYNNLKFIFLNNLNEIKDAIKDCRSFIFIEEYLSNFVNKPFLKVQDEFPDLIFTNLDYIYEEKTKTSTWIYLLWTVENSGTESANLADLPMISFQSTYGKLLGYGPKFCNIDEWWCEGDNPNNFDGNLDPGESVKGCIFQIYANNAPAKGDKWTLKLDPHNYIDEGTDGENNNIGTIKIPLYKSKPNNYH